MSPVALRTAADSAAALATITRSMAELEAAGKAIAWLGIGLALFAVGLVALVVAVRVAWRGGRPVAPPTDTAAIDAVVHEARRIADASRVTPLADLAAATWNIGKATRSIGAPRKRDEPPHS